MQSFTYFVSGECISSLKSSFSERFSTGSISTVLITTSSPCVWITSGRNTSMKDLELSLHSLLSSSQLLRQKSSALTNRCRGRPSNTSEEEELVGVSRETRTLFSSALSSVLVSTDSTRETLGLGRGPGVKYVEMLMSGRCASEMSCVVISPWNKISEFLNFLLGLKRWLGDFYTKFAFVLFRLPLRRLNAWFS